MAVDGVPTTFEHDAIGQLLSETRPGYAASYTYDANGNRMTRTVGTVTETYVTNERDELTSVLVDSVPVREYTVDLAGRTTSVTTSAGTTSFAYDLEDRVTSASYPGSGSSSYGYNGLDTRVSASGSFGSRTYRRAGAGVTAPVLGDGVSHFTPGLSVRTGSESRFQHFGLKNIDAQSSSSQTISASRTYDAFGNTVSSSGSWSGPFGYGGAFGYQSEPDSGLQLLGHRYYDPSAGRFLSRDKARDGGNWYAYCANAPLTSADPDGCAVLTVCGLVLLVVLAAEGGAEEIRRDPHNLWAYVVPFIEVFGGFGLGKIFAKLSQLSRFRPGALPMKTAVGRRISPDKILKPPTKRGKPPTGIDGKPVEVHHRDQQHGILDEMTFTEHRGKGNFKKNHPHLGARPSEIDRNKARQEVLEHWQKRYDEDWSGQK